MKAADSGWTADLNLQPGRYAYKYIVDGKWINDPSNNLKEDDRAGGYNSIVYCPNNIFRLKGYTNARRVVVTGNFFNWNQHGLAMQKTDEGWALPIWFRDGTYAYKFIVDNQWMTDLANPVQHKDKAGNDNSFISIGEPYLFKLVGHADAGKVFLAGNFNGWNEAELLMDKTGKGWQLPYVLPAGNYEYKFIADGTWMTDPENPFSTGSGKTVNSFIALKANHLFELADQNDAKSVIVTGSFNNWSTRGYRMVKQGGKWIFPLFLKPGKHLYKFIVDGKWIIDPANDLYEPNEVGTDNSVLWIKP
jgi:1,4-alpha-glucan branching enzyme